METKMKLNKTGGDFIVALRVVENEAIGLYLGGACAVVIKDELRSVSDEAF
jgi:hypothetical protein